MAEEEKAEEVKAEETETEEKAEESAPEETKTKKSSEKSERYAGFGIRLVALIIDGILVSIAFRIISAIIPFGSVADTDLLSVKDSLLGTRSIVNQVLQMAYFVLMTSYYGATVGKMAMGIKVVDAKTGEKPSLGQAAMREIIGKFVSGIVIGLGFLWVAFDGKKQGWHDKIASTYVIKS